MEFQDLILNLVISIFTGFLIGLIIHLAKLKTLAYIIGIIVSIVTFIILYIFIFENQNTLPNGISTKYINNDQNYGYLSIQDIPRDAYIYIDYNLLNGLEYSNIPLSVGKHLIEIKGTKYELYKKMINIEHNKKHVIQIKLKSKRGTLSLNTYPEGAEIYIAGEKYGTTPMTFKNIEIGEYQIEFKLENFKTKKKLCEVYHNQINKYYVELEEIYGSLELSASEKAKVYINDQYSGTTPVEKKSISIGTYKIKLITDLEVWEKVINIEPNKVTKVYHVFSPTGSLSVNSIPWGVVFIDGIEYGTTPLKIEKLVEGEHLIKITRKGYISYTKRITIKSGERMNIGIHLKKIIN